MTVPAEGRLKAGQQRYVTGFASERLPKSKFLLNLLALQHH